MAILTPALLADACGHIGGNDPIMAGLIARLPAARLERRLPPFHVLAASIINQQLSQKAAAAIQGRLALLAPEPFAPDDIIALSPQKLRGVGLSARKAEYLRALAAFARASGFSAAALQRLTDEQVIETLTRLPGIGRWTAEMFLMFCLRRPDVLPLADAGLLRSAKMLYGGCYRGSDADILQKAARQWQPWRSVGCYYLWRNLDNAPISDKPSGKPSKKTAAKN